MQEQFAATAMDGRGCGFKADFLIFTLSTGA
jgi:hypothetical protein